VLSVCVWCGAGPCGGGGEDANQAKKRRGRSGAANIRFICLFGRKTTMLSYGMVRGLGFRLHWICLMQMRFVCFASWEF